MGENNTEPAGEQEEEEKVNLMMQHMQDCGKHADEDLHQHGAAGRDNGGERLGGQFVVLQNFSKVWKREIEKRWEC